jgi:hypothetical protein
LQGKLSHYALQKPETAGVSNIIIKVEDVLAEFDNVLHADALQHKEQVWKVAEELAEQQRLLEEKETKHIASKRAKCQMDKELSKEYGGDAGSGCQVSGDTC